MALTKTPLVLSPGDLLDKWGFGDGDAGDQVLEEWSQGSWVAPLLVEGSTAASSVYRYCQPRVLLGTAIREFVLPRIDLPKGFRLTRVGSMHNPFRIAAPNGTVLWPGDADPEWDRETELAAARLCDMLPEVPPVVVPTRELDRLCGELFPQRPVGWLAWMTACSSAGVAVLLPNGSGEMFRWFDTLPAAKVADVCATLLPDEVLGLAAELLGNSVSPAFVREAPQDEIAAAVRGALDSAFRVAAPDGTAPLPDLAVILERAKAVPSVRVSPPKRPSRGQPRSQSRGVR